MGFEDKYVQMKRVAVRYRLELPGAAFNRAEDSLRSSLLGGADRLNFGSVFARAVPQITHSPHSFLQRDPRTQNRGQLASQPAKRPHGRPRVSWTTTKAPPPPPHTQSRNNASRDVRYGNYTNKLKSARISPPTMLEIHCTLRDSAPTSELATVAAVR